MSFSISGNRRRDTAQEQQADYTASAPQLRAEAYTVDDLHAAWNAFMAARPAEKILVNTMRASMPEQVDGNLFRVKVENEKQQQEILQAMPDILREVRDTLRNDSFNFAVEINQGQSSPYTWNEREVFAHMLNTIPALKSFVDEFKLSI